MKPETTSPSEKSKVKSKKEEEPSVNLGDAELSDDEKAVLNLLKADSPMDLTALKGQTGLSNKKWGKAIKGLTKNQLVKVEKTEAGLRVSVL
jgi:lysyl-tRNA synthetase class 2